MEGKGNGNGVISIKFRAKGGVQCIYMAEQSLFLFSSCGGLCLYIYGFAVFGRVSISTSFFY